MEGDRRCLESGTDMETEQSSLLIADPQHLQNKDQRSTAVGFLTFFNRFFKDKHRARVQKRRVTWTKSRCLQSEYKDSGTWSHKQATGGDASPVAQIHQLSRKPTTEGTASFSGFIKPIYISWKTPKTNPQNVEQSQRRFPAASGTSVFVKHVALVTK